MAKNKNGNGNGEVNELAEPNGQPPETTYSIQLPEGYEERSSDIAGFWDMKAPIHFIPLTSKLFDSNIEKSKISALIIGKAVGPHRFVSDDGEVTDIADGDNVGVWAKPGMSAIKDLAGVKVYMYYAGELQTGKPNPMKVFKIASKEKGSRLTVGEDFRKNSQAASHFLIEGGPLRPPSDAPSNARI